jgi:hypothetical protein
LAGHGAQIFLGVVRGHAQLLGKQEAGKQIEVSGFQCVLAQQPRATRSNKFLAASRTGLRSIAKRSGHPSPLSKGLPFYFLVPQHWKSTSFWGRLPNIDAKYAHASVAVDFQFDVGPARETKGIFFSAHA